MAKSFIILVLCIASVYSDTEMKSDLTKEMMPEKAEDLMAESAAPKPKRDSYYPYHGAPCPPYAHGHGYGSGWNKGWQPEYPKVQFIHQPAYIKPVIPIVKPHVPSYGHGWQPSYGHSYNKYYSKPAYPSYGYPSHGWQSPVVIKPSYPSYAPAYHKPQYNYHTNYIKPAVVVKPDCPTYPHYHGHGYSGISYAPHHGSYHHEPIVKVVKPVYHAPAYHAPAYHAPAYHAPVYQAPAYHAPVYHPAPVHIPKVEICD